MIGHAAAALLVLSPAASAPVSPDTETVEDFAENWRRARKLMRACEMPEELVRFISFSEGVMIAKKADESEYDGDTRDLSLGHQDRFRVSHEKCVDVFERFEPTIRAISEVLHCETEECPPARTFQAPAFD